MIRYLFLFLLLSFNNGYARELLNIDKHTSQCQILRALNGKNVPMECRSKGFEPRKTATLQDINFANGSALLTKTAESVLGNIAQAMNQTPDEIYHVQGHANKTGAYNKNLALSQQRAEVIKTFLENQGVSSERLIAEGFSYDRPLPHVDPVDGINRRVEFINNREINNEQ